MAEAAAAIQPVELGDLATTTEVKSVLRALTRKLDKDATDYTGQHIAMSLYGLQWMSGSR